MYAWIWRTLPNPWWVRAIGAVAIVVLVLFVLFEWVYPWLAPLLPFQQQTVSE